VDIIDLLCYVLADFCAPMQRLPHAMPSHNIPYVKLVVWRAVKLSRLNVVGAINGETALPSEINKLAGP
jgi:hypothetical protein